MIEDQKKWQNYVNKNKDEYGKCCVDVARVVMDHLDKEKEFDAQVLIIKASNELKEDITGFMAGAVASMVSDVHSRGDEFKKSWNNEVSGDKMGGVNNPALMTVETKK